MRFSSLLIGAALLWVDGLFGGDFAAAPQRFKQEIAVRFGVPEGLPEGGVQLVDLSADGIPRAFVAGSWYELKEGRWKDVEALRPRGVSEFVVPGETGKPLTVEVPWSKVKQIVRRGNRVWLATEEDPFVVMDGKAATMGWPSQFRVNQIAVDATGERVWVASSAGLYRRSGKAWQKEGIQDGLGRAWAFSDVLGVALDSIGQLWFATKAGVGVKRSGGWKFYEGKDGLPYNDFTGISAGVDGEVWFSTHLGAIRLQGEEWHYRQGPRWLPHDDVRQIVVGADGRAWCATAGGMGVIERRPMLLAEKAEHYEVEIEKYIKRTPFGFVAEAPLKRVADKSSADPSDSDNDGLWTAMYGAGECFAYGATRDRKSLERAKQAFEALRFLQKVTQGGNPQPPKGYIARTIRPTEWADPNVGRIERDREERKGDHLWKVYEPRWPKSADGKWYWKGDTSSDELDGHYFFYPLYFDLCAEDTAEKERVRDVVRGATDHLIDHGFNLVDHDGTPTRWGFFGPESLNLNPFWWPERGLNSLSILTYLTVAEHVTGDVKYGDRIRELVEKHGYAQNLMFPKVQFGPGSGNQSDDEMAFMCFYSFLRYSKNEMAKQLVRNSFFAYWVNEAPEMNPFFNFAHAAQNEGQTIKNVWGVFSVSPWKGWFEDSMATLRGFPLDRLNWPHKNSHRLDVQVLGRQKSKDLYDGRREARGHRNDGKVVPVENRHFNHWNTDPWDLDYGGNGGELASGTVFLLPYYMGLYHGYIEKP